MNESTSWTSAWWPLIGYAWLAAEPWLVDTFINKSFISCSRVWLLVVSWKSICFSSEPARASYNKESTQSENFLQCPSGVQIAWKSKLPTVLEADLNQQERSQLQARRKSGFHFAFDPEFIMVLHDIERTLCEGCSRRRRETIYSSIQGGKFNANDLQVGRLLGSGGFGSVYEARYRGERLVVKKLHRGTKNERAAQESFEAEGSILHFNHPNIVRSLAVLTLWGNVRCIIMEFAGERNLQSVINDPFQELGRNRRVQFALDIATALQFSHLQGLAHLDLKPGNVLVTAEDHCKLADFGCCRAVEENDKPASPTKSNLTGTYAYRAPELLKGESPSTKADIYSYGICLWQMLTRERPYGNENQHVVIFGVVAYQLRPELREDLAGDEHYVNLIKQCWQAEAKFRPAASEIVNRLQDIRTENNRESKVDHPNLPRICSSQVCVQNTRLN